MAWDGLGVKRRSEEPETSVRFRVPGPKQQSGGACSKGARMPCKQPAVGSIPISSTKTGM